jgi:arginine N-succinyltransferase
MNVIRPVRLDDLDGLFELSGKAGFGLTSLPNDKELLRERIEESVRSFELCSQRPMGELYLFVMEDLDRKAIIGTSCIVSKVGGFEPFYAYRIQKTVHASETLGVRKEIETLHLVKEHSGPCEIGGLFLHPDARRHGNGRVLSLFRFLFMAERRERFEPLIIAEMRGVVDENGHSPFWEAIGHHFFEIDFPKADYLSSRNKRFIADLMPTCPIYVPLLPQDARDVVGKVHEKTQPAIKMLQDEGFRFTGLVDIFEAGPVISCRLNDIRAVRESLNAVVDEITSENIDSGKFVITNTSEDFRACMGPVGLEKDRGLRLNTETARALNVKVGDTVRFSPLVSANRDRESK